MPTSPSLSRQSSRTGRHHYRSADPANPARSSSNRPGADRRDSSPLRTLATLGLMAGQAALGAAAPLQPAQARSLTDAASRMLEDGRRAMELSRRAQPVAPVMNRIPYNMVDWSQVDWEHLDWESVDWRQIDPDALPQTTTADVRYIQPQEQKPVVVSRSEAAQKPMETPATAPDAHFFAGIDAKQNAVAIVWRGAYTATFHTYANPGPYQPGLGEPYSTVQLLPNEYKTLLFPSGWSGRAQLMSGDKPSAADAATWPEFALNQWQGLSFFDISLIRGCNAGVSMRASDGSSRAEIPHDIMRRAPDNLKVKDSGGRMVIEDTEGYDGLLHKEVVDFLHTVTDTSQAYMQHSDDTATKSTPDHHLVIEFFE